MEVKLSQPGQGSTANRTQDTFVWGLGKPHPQVACETHWTDPPTHDSQQPRITCKHTYFTDSKFKVYPPRRRWARGHIMFNWAAPQRETFTAEIHETWTPVYAGGLSACGREARQSGRPSGKNTLRYMEASPCLRPYSVQVRSPTTRAVHYKNRHTHGRQSRPEPLLCGERKSDTAGGPTMMSLLSYPLRTKNNQGEHTHKQWVQTAL